MEFDYILKVLNCLFYLISVVVYGWIILNTFQAIYSGYFLKFTRVIIPLLFC